MYDHRLDTFITVADCGSFSKASKVLYVSPTAIIQQINLLEESYGFKLFDRKNSGVTLTAAGKSLYTDSQLIIQASQNSLMRARLSEKQNENLVRIGTSLVYKCRFLLKMLPEIQKRCPELTFKICSRDDTPGNMDAFGDDCDVIEGQFLSVWKDKYDFLELKKTYLHCYLSRNHPLAEKKSLTPEDLEGYTVMLPQKGWMDDFDEWRRQQENNYPSIKVIDYDGYEMSTLLECQFKNSILLLTEIYADIQNGLISIPFENSYVGSYSLIYLKDHSSSTQKLLNAVHSILSESR